MLWYKELFKGDSVAERADEIKRRLSKKKHVPGLYLITLASNGVDQLDILHYGINSRLMRQYLELPMIVGIAGNKKEALQIVQEILKQTYAQTGTADMRSWIIHSNERMNDSTEKEV